MSRRNVSGHRIQAARALHEPKLTQDDLIALMHTKENIVLSKNMLSRIETGDRYVTDVELMAFSGVLKVSVPGLLGETSVRTFRAEVSFYQAGNSARTAQCGQGLYAPPAELRADLFPSADRQ